MSSITKEAQELLNESTGVTKRVVELTEPEALLEMLMDLPERYDPSRFKRLVRTDESSKDPLPGGVLISRDTEREKKKKTKKKQKEKKIHIELPSPLSLRYRNTSSLLWERRIFLSERFFKHLSPRPYLLTHVLTYPTFSPDCSPPCHSHPFLYLSLIIFSSISKWKRKPHHETTDPLEVKPATTMILHSEPNPSNTDILDVQFMTLSTASSVVIQHILNTQSSTPPDPMVDECLRLLLTFALSSYEHYPWRAVLLEDKESLIKIRTIIMNELASCGLSLDTPPQAVLDIADDDFRWSRLSSCCKLIVELSSYDLLNPAFPRPRIPPAQAGKLNAKELKKAQAQLKSLFPPSSAFPALIGDSPELTTILTSCINIIVALTNAAKLAPSLDAAIHVPQTLERVTGAVFSLLHLSGALKSFMAMPILTSGKIWDVFHTLAVDMTWPGDIKVDFNATAILQFMASSDDPYLADLVWDSPEPQAKSSFIKLVEDCTKITAKVVKERNWSVGPIDCIKFLDPIAEDSNYKFLVAPHITDALADFFALDPTEFAGIHDTTRGAEIIYLCFKLIGDFHSVEPGSGDEDRYLKAMVKASQSINNGTTNASKNFWFLLKHLTNLGGKSVTYAQLNDEDCQLLFNFLDHFCLEAGVPHPQDKDPNGARKMMARKRPVPSASKTEKKRPSSSSVPKKQEGEDPETDSSSSTDEADEDSSPPAAKRQATPANRKPSNPLSAVPDDMRASILASVQKAKAAFKEKERQQEVEQQPALTSEPSAKKPRTDDPSSDGATVVSNAPTQVAPPVSGPSSVPTGSTVSDGQPPVTKQAILRDLNVLISTTPEAERAHLTPKNIREKLEAKYKQSLEAYRNFITHMLIDLLNS